MTSPSGDRVAELAAARDGSIVADLSDNALLRISGDDAAGFLHGQFTNDVQALSPGEAQWNGWCTAKGRLVATFLLARRAEGYLLMLPAEIAAAFAKRLSMYVLRSKVDIADVSADYARLGVGGPRAPETIASEWGEAPRALRSIDKDGATCIALDARRFVVLAPAAQGAALRRRFERTAVPASVAAWDWLAVHAGIPNIVAATQDAFVPQMANFDLVGGVSFHKGCYPGQEIVARTQYRGILKRRMALAHAQGAAVPKPGDSVYGTAFGDQAAGMVVQSAAAPEGGHDLLVVAQLESLAARDLRLGSPDGPALEVRDFPAIATAS